MEKEISLVIMAAGMGSRFGGLKQIEPVGPSSEFIIDYSIYDALKAGFNKVIFIIKEENYDIFKSTIGKRIENIVNVSYVFQNSNNLPAEYKEYASRVKPWGTAHAVLCAKNEIKGDFLVINSDDFYGSDSYKKAYEFLTNTNSEHALISYEVANTLSENGSVKRGVCDVSDGYLNKIIESKIDKENGVIVAHPLDGSDSFDVKDNDRVSMNMFCLSKDFINDLESNFKKFLDDNKDDLSDCEYLLPNMVTSCNKKVKVINTSSIWMGITYKEDKETFIKGINELINNNVYPKDLYKEKK